mgnify:CR=1 FL=1
MIGKSNEESKFNAFDKDDDDDIAEEDELEIQKEEGKE